MSNTNKSTSIELIQRAEKVIPGGVNSPVRAFKAVGGSPLFIKKAKGVYLYDEDDNVYIDLINSWGPMFLGHAHEKIQEAVYQTMLNSFSFGAPTRLEVEMAELIVEMVPSIEKVRMVNSGTEATMSAVRLARGYTGKNKIIKLEGCYHGHADPFLIAAGSGAITIGNPDSPGVTLGTAQDTLLAPYNDLNAIENLIHAHKDIACMILEPVAGNMGCVLPTEGYLKGLRTLCDQHGILLIFDEVMTGFRLSTSGAQGLFGIRPDLTTLGKIIGGGMPVGAFGGKKEIMDQVAPQGKVYQAGTLSGNPVAMAAGKAMLKYLNENPDAYNSADHACQQITEGIKAILQELKLPFTLNRIGSMYSLFFTDRQVNNFEDAQTSDTRLFSLYFQEMLAQGIYLAPSQFESLFISTLLEEKHTKKIIEANQRALKKISEIFIKT